MTRPTEPAPLFPCCIPDIGCRLMEDEAECIAAGGYDNIVDCTDPDSECLEAPDPTPMPEGCYNGAPTWGHDSGRAYHTLDICEMTVAEPAFIERIDSSSGTRFEPVSSHLSRAQPVGAGQDPCLLNEGFVTINAQGDADILMCTGRGMRSLAYAVGVLVIPYQEEAEDEEDYGEPPEHAKIVFSTESPFPLEVNLFSQGHICGGLPI